MFTKTFWKQAAERAVKTFAQAALALLTVDGLDLLTVHWGTLAATAGLAAVVSVLTSVVSAGIGAPSSPSLVATEPAPVAATPAAPVKPSG